MKAEPKSAAENYARLRAEVTGAEVKLQTLRSSLANSAPEVLHQEALLAALRRQLSRAEDQDSTGGSTEYITRYRNFKYEEALFDIFAKQFELARVDESREGALIQVVDEAFPPERKSKPKRIFIAAGSALFGFLMTAIVLVAISTLRQRRNSP